MKFLLLSLVPLAALAGCATTRVAAEDQRAYCQRMAQRMGIDSSHDHGETKGMGPSAMNQSHARCKATVAGKK